MIPEGGRVLAFDPGAKRMGWSVLRDKSPAYIASGINGLLMKPEEKYQEYRLRLIDYWTFETARMLSEYVPEIVVSEVLPVRGFSNMSQALLAATAITTVQTMAVQNGTPVAQIAAPTIKTRIGGSHKATKVKVRNGVLQILPELADKKGQWTKVFDEPDAIAVALTHLGFDIRA